LSQSLLDGKLRETEATRLEHQELEAKQAKEDLVLQREVLATVATGARKRRPRGWQRGQGSLRVEAGAKELGGVEVLCGCQGTGGAEAMGWLGDQTRLEVVGLRTSRSHDCVPGLA